MAQLTDDQVADAVAFLAQARARGGPLPAFPEACRPATIGDAYRIAQATRSPADTRPDGWKAGASSAAQMRDAGLATPPVAPLFPGVLCESPADLDGATYHLCIMEAEVAFRLAAGLPSRPAPYTMPEVRDAVAGAHLVIEAVNFPFADGPAVGLPSIVAGGFAVGSLVVGPSIDDWAARDLKTLDVELLIDGECVARGLEGDARCDPLGVLHGDGQRPLGPRLRAGGGPDRDDGRRGRADPRPPRSDGRGACGRRRRGRRAAGDRRLAGPP